MAKNIIKSEELLEKRVLIRDSVIRFINLHCGASVGGLVNLDEIVLDYVVGVLSEEDAFEVEEFSEMLSAYFPSFESIPESVVMDWVQELLIGIRKEKSKESKKITDFFGGLGQDEELKKSEPSSMESDENFMFFMAVNGEGQRNRICSESSTVSSSSSSASSSSTSMKSHQSQEKLETLLEMFPNLSLKDAGGVLSLASGELERAVQIVLIQMEDNLRVKCRVDDEEEVEDNDVLKERLVKRYGFIDQAQDAKEFRPLLPKEEPKKLVRYREGQVVSTKGERYSEVAINKDGEEVKFKPYISKPHKFH